MWTETIVLWILGGLLTVISVLVCAIGNWIVSEIRTTRSEMHNENETIRNEVNAVRDALNSQVGQLRSDFSRDLGGVRERIARVEGAVFPPVKSGVSD